MKAGIDVVWFLFFGKTGKEEIFVAQQTELLMARTSEKEGFLEKRKNGQE